MPTEKHITLSELLAGVKIALAERFPLGVWISAEIGELKENRYSGHCYLELIEKGEREGTPKAKASAAIWRSRWGIIESHFRATTGTTLAAGMKVLLKVSVSFHEAYGLSLVVSDIDPSYTLGENEKRRREVIAALTADGVIDLNHQLARPPLFQRVAVISSATAAGLQDFHNHLAESPYCISYTLFEAIMQGAAAEESIIAALGEVAEREEEFDCVALLRGGGSQSDLACFNSYSLCSHIAQFPLPVLTGIGHDKDTSVADMVAAESLKTPTAVADYLVGRIDGYVAEVESLYERIGQTAGAVLAAHNNRLVLCGTKLQAGTQRLLGSLGLQLERAQMRLAHAAERTLADHAGKLATLEAKVLAASPERILNMGFALVRSGGKSVSDASLLHEGDTIEIALAKGSVEATVTQYKN
ncbi:MAG: exodeoxyribonuclease VII large subunit [Tidjanibacter sp.]|nr:exodeoxyribonuclease VII large subunit [Tidjanibacter sp.]